MPTQLPGPAQIIAVIISLIQLIAAAEIQQHQENGGASTSSAKQAQTSSDHLVLPLASGPRQDGHSRAAITKSGVRIEQQRFHSSSPRTMHEDHAVAKPSSYKEQDNSGAEQLRLYAGSRHLHGNERNALHGMAPHAGRRLQRVDVMHDAHVHGTWGKEEKDARQQVEKRYNSVLQKQQQQMQQQHQQQQGKTSLPAAKRHAYVAACAIFKNEHGNIREWISYHR
jgi:hypothetical protein